MANDDFPNKEDWVRIVEILEEVAAGEQSEAERRGTVSFWHTPQKRSPGVSGFQSHQECSIAWELAKSLREKRVADIGMIIANSESNAFPDCFAELDGKRIGIEVTELIAANEVDKEWTHESFEQALVKRILDKDAKANIPTRVKKLGVLDQLFLVVCTDERHLSPETIAAYLRHVRMPEPLRIDRVFFLGPYEAERNNAVVRGRKHEPPPDRARFTAVEVQRFDA